MSTDWPMPFSFDPVILPRMKPSTPSKPPLSVARAATRKKAPPKSAIRQSQQQSAAEAMTVSDDEAAFRECLAGICRQNQPALGRFYDLTVSRVYAVALRIVRRIDLAEEVVSDVYVQVWRDAYRYDDDRGRVLGWLLVIARSRALDLLRRQEEAFSHPDPYDLVDEPESTQQPDELLAAAQEGAALHHALQKLNPTQRQLLSQAFFRGLSHQEIAEQSHMPLGTVKTHIRRALGEMRKTLGAEALSGEWS